MFGEAISTTLNPLSASASVWWCDHCAAVAMDFALCSPSTRLKIDSLRVWVWLSRKSIVTNERVAFPLYICEHWRDRGRAHYVDSASDHCTRERATCARDRGNRPSTLAARGRGIGQAYVRNCLTRWPEINVTSITLKIFKLKRIITTYMYICLSKYYNKNIHLFIIYIITKK